MEDHPTRPDLLMFLASAAHDMKNSIGMLSGTLETVLRDPAVQAMPAYRQMAHLLYETRRMNDNLMQLLTLYKEVGSSSYPFDPRPQAIAGFVEEVEAQHRVLLEAQGIVFEADYPPELIWCFDEDLVVGVVGHALNNAIHYTGDKSGQQVLEEAKLRDLVGPSCIWLMVSAVKNIESVMGAAEYQPDGYLLKPLTEAFLLTRLNRAWARKQAFKEIDRAYDAKDYLKAAELCDARLGDRPAARIRPDAHEGKPAHEKRRAGIGARGLRASHGRAGLRMGEDRPRQDTFVQRRI